MADEGVQDLLGLDRDVARATTALAQWRSTLAGEPGDADDDPFDGQRRVASRSTWELLAALSPSKADEPLREALRRWVVALVQARLALVDDRALAQAAAARAGHFEGSLPRAVSWPEAWHGAAAAKTPSEVELWLAAAAEIGPSLASATRLRAARRLEVARRMGFSHPWQPLVGPAGPASLRASARRFLERTDDLSRFVWGELFGPEARPADVLHAAVGREAGDGWPARLTPRWLEEQFGAGVRGLALTLPPLPQTLGAASFARALAMFGFAFRLALAPAGMPFALAREPAFTGAHRLAFVFGALAADTSFQLKNLGVGRRSAHAQTRVLARTAFLEARLGAARIVLGEDGAARDQFDDISARLFGAPLEGRFHGAWPVARDDEPARWVGLLQAPSLAASLRATFDTDWFRNPRAWAHLRSQGVGPAREPVEDAALDAGGDALVRSFEEALG
jgi:hypothetical protein